MKNNKLYVLLFLIIGCFIFSSKGQVSADEIYHYDETTYSLKREIKITEQPVSQIYVKGQKITSKVVATGGGLKYQWEYRLPKDSGWTKLSAPGNNTAETAYAYPAVFNGIKLRCVINDIYGNKVISDEIVLRQIENDEWELPII